MNTNKSILACSLLVVFLITNNAFAQDGLFPAPDVMRKVDAALTPYKAKGRDIILRQKKCSPGELGEYAEINSELKEYKFGKEFGNADLYSVKLKVSLNCSIYRRTTTCPGEQPNTENEGPMVNPVQVLTTDLVVYGGKIIHVGEFVNTTENHTSEEALRCGRRVTKIRGELLN